MKKTLFLTFSILLCIGSAAQNTAGKTDDAGRIALTTYLPDNMDLPNATTLMLKTKMDQMATAAGMAGGINNSRFIITAVTNVENASPTSTAPPMVAMTLDVTFHIGDGVDGTLFSSKNVTVKGVGTNTQKAYTACVKQIKPLSPDMQAFVAEGKNKIMQYYNTNCDFINKQAQTLAAQKKYNEALFLLTSVPDVCKDCYDKCMDAVGAMYVEKINNDCVENLAQATLVWNASQDLEGANAALTYLGEINPDAACYKDAVDFSNQIAQKVKALGDREWKQKMKDKQDTVDIEKARIRAAQEVGVAYGKNQPQNVTYKTSAW